MTWEPNHSSVLRKCEVKSLKSKPEAGWVEREWKILVFPRWSLYFALQTTESSKGFSLQKRLHHICILKDIFSTNVDKGMKTGKTENSKIRYINRGILVIHSLSHVWLFATPWTVARQASLSFTISQSLLKLMSIESVMPSSHLILCRPLLLLPSIFPNIRVFSIESALCIRWPNSVKLIKQGGH